MGRERTDDDAQTAHPYRTRLVDRVCLDCDWYRIQINRAAGDPQPRADLEALYDAHLRRCHDGHDGHDERVLRSV